MPLVPHLLDPENGIQYASDGTGGAQDSAVRAILIRESDIWRGSSPRLKAES